MAVPSQKVVILLTESRDWDWYEVIRSTPSESAFSLSSTSSRNFEQQEKALNEIFALIAETTARQLRKYTRDLHTPYDILQALRTRLEPTSFTRGVDLSREYQSLKHVNKNTYIERWLMKWETA